MKRRINSQLGCETWERHNGGVYPLKEGVHVFRYRAHREREIAFSV